MSSRFLLRGVLPATGLLLALSARAATIVSGHIIHPKGTEVAVFYGSEPLSGQPEGVVRGQLDAKGNFRLELPGLKRPSEAHLAHGPENTSLFLSPGDNLRLELDPERFDESLRYTGTGANINNYLAQAFLKFDDYENLPEPKPLTTGSAVENIRSLANGQRSKRLAFLKTYAAVHPLPPAARAFARQSIAFTYANDLLALPMQLRGGMLKGTPSPGPEFYSFLSTVKPAQDSALASGGSVYRDYLRNYAAALPEIAQASTSAALLTTATRQFGESYSRDLVITKYLTAEMSADVSKVAPVLPLLRASLRDSALARAVRSTYVKRLALSPGRPAPGFTVRDVAGKEVSLRDYEGKVVYLDFWASWCGPCMAEVPAGEKLKKQFEGQDVVFLYVSIDDEEANWKKALAKHPLTSPNSVHGWAKGWEAAAPVAYQVEGIPAYFLIARNGTILSNNAARPSDGETTVAQLRSALSK